MKNSRGYTVIELIILLVVLGAITTAVVIGVMGNFKGDNDDVYDSTIKSLLKTAEVYGRDKIEDIKQKNLTITVQTLADAGKLPVPKDGKIANPRNPKTSLNDMKIILSYDKKTDKVTAEVVE